MNISVSTPSIAFLKDKILPQALPPVYLHFVYLTSSRMLKPFGPPPLFLHIVSDQKLEAGMAWERGFLHVHVYVPDGDFKGEKQSL